VGTYGQRLLAYREQIKFDEDGNILPVTITKDGVLGQVLEDN